MKGLETFTLTRLEATAKWKETIEAQKKAADKELRKQLEPMRYIYHRLRDGKSVVDLFASMKKAPLNHDGEPRLAVFPLGSNEVHFQKNQNGAGAFAGVRHALWSPRFNTTVTFPEQTFGGQWPIERMGKAVLADPRREIKTPAAPCPPRFVPTRTGPYFILQEVERWEPEPTKDPALLQRVTRNLFIVEAEWDLSPLERAFIRGTL